MTLPKLLQTAIIVLLLDGIYLTTLSSTFAKMIKNIETELIKIRQQGSMKPVQVNATEEQIKKGAPASYQVPITFDNANFFE